MHRNGTGTPVTVHFTNDATGTAVTDGAIIGIDAQEDIQIRNRENRHIEFFTNDALRMILLNTGLVGIGVSNPLYKFHVAGGGRVYMGRALDDPYNLHLKTSGNVATKRSAIALENYGGEKIIIQAIGPVVDSEGDFLISTDSGGGEIPRFTIKQSNGYVGIGIATPEEKLHVNNGNVLIDNSEALLTLQKQDNNNGNKILLQNSAGFYEWNIYQTDGGASDLRIAGGSDTDFDNLIDYLTIEFGGNVGIGTDNPLTPLHVNLSSNGTVLRLQDIDGTCLHNPEAGSETISCSSDEKLKEGIQETDSILEDFEKIKIRDYIVKKSGKKITGTIAQEMLETNPDMVHEENGELFVEQPNPWKLLKAIQELKKEVDHLNENSSGKSKVFDETNFGIATLKTGKTEVSVNFNKKYAKTPIITITPVGLPNFFYGISEITTSGFKILISNPQEKDISFTWQAFESDKEYFNNIPVVNYRKNNSNEYTESGLNVSEEILFENSTGSNEFIQENNTESNFLNKSLDNESDLNVSGEILSEKSIGGNEFMQENNAKNYVNEGDFLLQSGTYFITESVLKFIRMIKILFIS
jgi:hypothetical protein